MWSRQFLYEHLGEASSHFLYCWRARKCPFGEFQNHQWVLFWKIEHKDSKSWSDPFLPLPVETETLKGIRTLSTKPPVWGRDFVLVFNPQYLIHGHVFLHCSNTVASHIFMVWCLRIKYLLKDFPGKGSSLLNQLDWWRLNFYSCLSLSF